MWLTPLMDHQLKECQVFSQSLCLLLYTPSLLAAEHDLQRVVVQYEVLPGWKSKTAGLTSFSALPPNAQAYVHTISQLVQVPSESQKLLWEVFEVHHSLLLFPPHLYGPHPHSFAFICGSKTANTLKFATPLSLSLSLSLSLLCIQFSG